MTASKPPHPVLPRHVEARSLAARGVALSGLLALAKLPRLAAAVVGADGDARVAADFGRDEEGRYVLDLHATLTVRVACQRCLEPMPVDIDAGSRLAIVWTDAQAAALPEHLEPLHTAEETDLWAVAEDELLLALPPFSYHDDPDCAQASGRAPTPEPDAAPPVADGNNPFDVLKKLKDELE